ncbi:3-carboxyethylcatechol 2,3-dioxygenase [Marinobacter zhejiangensis]|uniref:2,3-dihydroxyphenylpropionate/2,3-dihydroxicinnamic acid 1,2-dioxygenase n=1 Tax=Marinobacter zhejiangensis TaxID=488535 RepID=A0A1I4T510_9GAMM|nr:3-carboxyethylcatechol 2,3-dioxygenase [Marinobacter zhejiangensis]SFM71759.1 2,3-dihydroxyphenylpropionate 1,2-dioxygenase [Marinobacter zhejiangensis]
MKALLQCLSHTPLVGHVDPEQYILEEVNNVIDEARKRIETFDPELVLLFSPDHYNGFFYDIMPSFCIGTHARAIGDFGTAAGELTVPAELSEQAAQHVMNAGVDVALSHRMQVDHGFAQPLEFLLGGLDKLPVIPVFINSVAVPLPSFQRARLLGDALGQYLASLNKRVLIIGSGGLSHQPPIPELPTANEHIKDRLLGSGRDLPAEERKARTNRVIDAARKFVDDQNTLRPLNAEWDQWFLEVIASGNLAELDQVNNQDVSDQAGKSTHEVKTWVAAAAAMAAFGQYTEQARYYRPIPEWIAGYGALTAAQG